MWLYFVTKGGQRILGDEVTAEDIYLGNGYGDPDYGKIYNRFSDFSNPRSGGIPMDSMYEDGNFFIRMRPGEGDLFHFWGDRSELPSDLDYMVASVFTVN